MNIPLSSQEFAKILAKIRIIVSNQKSHDLHSGFPILQKSGLPAFFSPVKRQN